MQDREVFFVLSSEGMLPEFIQAAFKVGEINEKQIFFLTKLPMGKAKVQKNRRFLIY